ncbi:MAG: diguanylate cyclase [Betaproteobacteria bacterium HGW-Betaproteobacteria-1]|jgi:EAL domain-containing protein (putative c-di-GMP-specific phosphodiesterase class I)/GGDEF domain-containing protein|nr:MAG: diguanylate cyclase [Betaproteobacteria bacterium HGW-Betaproteobacteria-1]
MDIADRYLCSVFDELDMIIDDRGLHAVFQPVINLANAEVLGHEGLIRGPVDSQLHSPLCLFQTAKEANRLAAVEQLSSEVVLETFGGFGSHSRLFINVSPESFTQFASNIAAILAYTHKLGLDPRTIVIELTESTPNFDYQRIKDAAVHYRKMGFEIAIDDLGEGFSSLRLWSELHPDYVKIDKHFIQNINNDSLKLEFVRSIQRIAECSGAMVIAEGIESQAQLSIVKDLKIAYGQGYLFARPAPQLLPEVPPDVREVILSKRLSIFPSAVPSSRLMGNLSGLHEYLDPVAPETTNDEVYAIFEACPHLYSLPVVRQGTPLGLISRYSIVDSFARLYVRELYGKKPCRLFMDNRPLIVEHDMGLHALSDLITRMEPHHLSNGFIVAENGAYLGVGSGHALLRAITQMQIDAARYANPLTMLPGNVPINEHIDRLIAADAGFVACYFDLDNFKPFNDAYGFRRGDEVIQFVGALLSQEIDPNLDFLGHVGGDDFIVVFQSLDWEVRCQQIMQKFEGAATGFYDGADRERSGIQSEDRLGNRVFYPIVSLSIGAARIMPCLYGSHHEVSAAMVTAKKQAKQMPGCSLFIERRIP